MRLLSFIAVVVPALIFAFAGMAKLLDPFPMARFLSNALWLSLPAALTVARFVATFEMPLAAALCFLLHRSRIPAYAGICLLAFFCGLLVEVLWLWPGMASCGCFGNLSVLSNPPSPRVQLSIDLGLMALLSTHLLLFSRKRPQPAAQSTATS